MDKNHFVSVARLVTNDKNEVLLIKSPRRGGEFPGKYRQVRNIKLENLNLVPMQKYMIEECVDLFIDTFTKEPWNDDYESRNEIVNFFNNHINNNYFVGYVAMLDNKAVALSVGMKKPWLKGFEYYIDEFCVSYNMQGEGVGSWFLTVIEDDIKKHGMNAIILNTEKDYPSHRFYEKNGFKVIKDMIVLAK